MHNVKENENMYEMEWEYKCVFSSFKSNSRGVAILFNNNFEYDIKKIKVDTNGNFVAMDIVIEDYNMTLIAIYGPNEDTTYFYNQLKNMIDEFEDSSICLCGDWNLVLDYERDTQGY